MKALVNDNCISCGLCVNICPSVFSMGDSGIAEASPEVPEGLEEQTAEARDSCPVEAIETD
jgi:ferredoxin